MVHRWISSSAYSELPRFAIKGGYDCDSTPIYVGRCYHEGDMLPAKVIPSKSCAYVAWGGQEHVKHEYDILIGPGYGWVPSQHGGVPHNAVSSGDCTNGEPLYIGRGHHNNSLVVGKVHSSHGCLYVPFGGQEVRLQTYEVLVQEESDNWLPASLEYSPPGAVVAGHDTDGTEIYVARAMHGGVMLPAKFVPDRAEAYVASDGCEIHKSAIEVLCGHNYTWVNQRHDDVPPNAVYTGRDHSGEPMFVGRAHHNGSLAPGLISLEESCLLIPYGGGEVRVGNYEVLIRN